MASKIVVELNPIWQQNCIPKNDRIETSDNHIVSLPNITVHYIQQLGEAEHFRRFIDDIIWMTTSETFNGGIRQAFAHSDLE